MFNGAGRGDASSLVIQPIEGARILNLRTRSELKAMMENQLKRVNKIYKEIDFGGITGIHFKIGGFRVKIYQFSFLILFFSFIQRRMTLQIHL